MQALILAAGRGLRLNGTGGGLPKCLAQVGGRTLLQHHLQALSGLGVADVTIVIGFGSDQVREDAGDVCRFIENPLYAHTNSLFSLWLARDIVREDMILINADVLAAPMIYGRVVADNTGSRLAYDSASGDEDEHMKVGFAQGLLADIGKNLAPEETDGESIGILYFDRYSARALMQAANELIHRGAMDMWAPAAVRRIARSIRMEGIDVKGLPWTEIDFPDDLKRARDTVWPRIHAPGRRASISAS